MPGMGVPSVFLSGCLDICFSRISVWLLNAQLSALWCVFTCVCLSVCMYAGIPLTEEAWKQPCRAVKSPSLNSVPHPASALFLSLGLLPPLALLTSTLSPSLCPL